MRTQAKAKNMKRTPTALIGVSRSEKSSSPYLETSSEECLPLAVPQPEENAGPSTPTGKKSSAKKALIEVKILQSRTCLLIPRASFRHVMKEEAEKGMKIFAKEGTQDGKVQIQDMAYEALHEASECYLVHLLEAANLCAIHANRRTLQVKDLNLAIRLKQ